MSAKMYKDRNWLHQKYYVEKLSTGQMATLCKVNRTIILYWMRKFDMPRRPRVPAMRVARRSSRRYTDWGRVCGICNTYKSWSCFNRDSTSRTGWAGYCKDCAREFNRASRQRHPETYRASTHRRRALKLAAPGTFTANDEKLLYEAYVRQCMKCGTTNNLTLDHIVPLAKGGDNHISNMQILCRSCNSSKSTQTIDYRPQLCSWYKSVNPLWLPAPPTGLPVATLV